MGRSVRHEKSTLKRVLLPVQGCQYGTVPPCVSLIIAHNAGNTAHIAKKPKLFLSLAQLPRGLPFSLTPGPLQPMRFLSGRQREKVLARSQLFLYYRSFFGKVKGHTLPPKKKIRQKKVIFYGFLKTNTMFLGEAVRVQNFRYSCRNFAQKIFYPP